MGAVTEKRARELGPSMAQWSLPAKALATMIVLMLAVGMAGALGQIVVHDIIPTFWGAEKEAMPQMAPMPAASSGRGDLFADAAPEAEKSRPAFYQTDEFIFALKFTHIHIFGMSGIFIAMGALVLFLDLEIRARTALITLPFVGILIDLTSVWLKIFVHPAFFWLHIPGGVLFGLVFAVDSLLVLQQLWGRQTAAAT
jgi:hypothetical protein